MNTKALFQVLSQKFKDGEIIFVDSFVLDAPKTKDAKLFLDSLAKNKELEMVSKKKKNAVFIANTELNQHNIKSFSNLANVKTGEFRKLNILDLLNYKFLIIINPAESLKVLEEKITK